MCDGGSEELGKGMGECRRFGGLRRGVSKFATTASPITPSLSHFLPHHKKKEFRGKKNGDDVQIPNIEITYPAKEIAGQREVEVDGEKVTLLLRKKVRKRGRDEEMLSVRLVLARDWMDGEDIQGGDEYL